MRAVQPPVSYADLARWPDDGRQYELYGGEPIVVPAPFPRHQQVVIELVSLFSNHRRRQGGRVLCAPIDIVLSQYDVVQPDVVWFDRTRLHLLDEDAAITVLPDLAIEVLSRSTAARDRGRKRELLGRYGLAEYWIIDPVQPHIEIYRNRSGSLVLEGVYDGDAEIVSPALAPLRFTVDAVFPGLETD